MMQFEGEDFIPVGGKGGAVNTVKSAEAKKFVDTFFKNLKACASTKKGVVLKMEPSSTGQKWPETSDCMREGGDKAIRRFIIKEIRLQTNYVRREILSRCHAAFLNRNKLTTIYLGWGKILMYWRFKRAQFKKEESSGS